MIFVLFVCFSILFLSGSNAVPEFQVLLLPHGTVALAGERNWTEERGTGERECSGLLLSGVCRGCGGSLTGKSESAPAKYQLIRASKWGSVGEMKAFQHEKGGERGKGGK